MELKLLNRIHEYVKYNYGRYHIYILVEIVMVKIRYVIIN
jgi:hypothetical protein